MKLLFIDACVREQSRTRVLAHDVLRRIGGEPTVLSLPSLGLAPLDRQTLEQRETLLREGRTDAPQFDLARRFAEADEIVIAAPFWDLGFPALLKVYLEQISVAGITFEYRCGRPTGLCRARRLTYVTTAGGRIECDFGYAYIKALARGLYGIPSTCAVCAEELDVRQITPEQLLSAAPIRTWE